MAALRPNDPEVDEVFEDDAVRFFISNIVQLPTAHYS